MSDLSSIDLGAIVASIKPSMVTPHLSEVVDVPNDKKIRVVSNLIIKQMVDDYNRSEASHIPKIIMHEGEMIELRHIDVAPLMMGIWPVMSLMLLHLSYGEQTMLIEAVYPKTTQFAAKAFGAVFTKETARADNSPVELKTDPEIAQKLDSANAGIAMIIAILGDQGYRTPHADKVNDKLSDMNDLVDAASKELQFKDATRRAQNAAQFRDR